MTYFTELVSTLQALVQEWPEALALLADTVRYASAHGNTVWLCGNGGSHATAQHWACDLEKAAGVCARALGTNTAFLTAVANDEAYDQALARELALHARQADILICLSCSGTSPNIRAVQDVAISYRMITVLITGGHQNGKAMIPPIHVPSEDYGIIEDCFAAIGHWLTEELCASS